MEDAQDTLKEIAEYLNGKFKSKYFCQVVFVTDMDEKQVKTTTLSISNIDARKDAFDVVKAVIANFRNNAILEADKFFQPKIEEGKKREESHYG